MDSLEDESKIQEIAKQLRRLASSLQDLANSLSGEKTAAVGREKLAEQLREELGVNLQQVDIILRRENILIRPRRFLGAEVFRSIADVTRKRRGRWDRGRRCFVIPLD